MSGLLKILVVDDNEVLRDTLADILKPEYDVLTARNGTEAYEFVKSNAIDVVISDVHMANGTGIELLEWIRASHGTKPSVILITGHSDNMTEDALKKGALGVLTKPFTRKNLIEIIQKIPKPSVSA